MAYESNANLIENRTKQHNGEQFVLSFSHEVFRRIGSHMKIQQLFMRVPFHEITRNKF